MHLNNNYTFYKFNIQTFSYFSADPTYYFLPVALQALDFLPESAPNSTMTTYSSKAKLPNSIFFRYSLFGVKGQKDENQ